MSSFRAAVVAAIVVLGTVLAVPFAGAFALTDAAAVGAQDDGPNATDGNTTDGNTTDGNTTDENATGEPSVGTQMSSFMQTSSTNATSEVESGMFEAEYERADNRTAVVAQRADRIERQIERLHERKRDLTEREGELNDVAYTARMSRIAGEIEALERQIDGTTAKAERTGVAVERFDRMRANVSELRGPQVRAAADAIPGRGPPADRGPGERGPPDDRGGDAPGDRGGDAPDGAEAGANGPGGAGPSDDASPGDDGGDRAGNDRGSSTDGGERDAGTDDSGPSGAR